MSEPTEDAGVALRDLVASGTWREIEQAVIERRLARLGTIPKAAESLGLSLAAMYHKVQRYRFAAVRREWEAGRKGPPPR